MPCWKHRTGKSRGTLQQHRGELLRLDGIVLIGGGQSRLMWRGTGAEGRRQAGSHGREVGMARHVHVAEVEIACVRG